jgi:hypothetical protein
LIGHALVGAAIVGIAGLAFVTLLGAGRGPASFLSMTELSFANAPRPGRS